MATLTKGHTFASGDTVTATKLNNLVDSATISAIQTADISDNQITTAKIVDANVTDAKLATGAVTGAAGGGKLAASAITGQTQKTSIADADELLVHSDSDSALRRVAWSVMQPSGTVLQTVYVEDATYKTATGRMPASSFADAPAVTEGTEILTANITPSSESHKVLVRCCVPITTISTGSNVSYAVFRGSTCIQFSTKRASVGSNDTYGPMYLDVLDSPNSTSAQTYSLRIGPTENNATVRLNGDTTQEYGGTAKITLTLQEIKA
jgi:hypothetical protein